MTNAGRSFVVDGAAELAPRLAHCALRYVLTDDLTRLCAELGFSTEDQLTQCLDLVRLPAESLWIEWNEAAELAGCREFFREAPLEVSAPGARAGMHVRSSSEGRRALVRFVWSYDGEPVISPFEAAIDFADHPFRQCALGDLLQGGWVAVSDSCPAVAELLTVARFRLEPTWADYYRNAVPSPVEAAAVRASLGGPARSIPLLVAFLLLLNSREGVNVRSVDWKTLNRKRVKNGRPPLLSHVEAALALNLPNECRSMPSEKCAHARFGPRRHHVRGHLVRRSNRVYWRRPHVRGSVWQGEVRSRTVTLSFDAAVISS